MDYNFLPDTDIEVSKICLGTMTWGRQIVKPKDMLKWIMQ